MCNHSGHTIRVTIGFCHTVTQTPATPGYLSQPAQMLRDLTSYPIRFPMGADPPYTKPRADTRIRSYPVPEIGSTRFVMLPKAFGRQIEQRVRTIEPVALHCIPFHARRSELDQHTRPPPPPRADVLQPPPNARGAFSDLRLVMPGRATEPARVSDRPASRAARLHNHALHLDRGRDRGRLAGHRKAQLQVRSFRRSHERRIIGCT